MRFYFVLLLLFSCLSASAQKGMVESDIRLADSQLKKANELYKRQSFDSASRFYKGAALVYQNQSSWDKYFDCMISYALCLWEAGQSEKALKESGRILEQAKRRGKASFKQFEVFYEINARESIKKNELKNAEGFVKQGLDACSKDPGKDIETKTKFLVLMGEIQLKSKKLNEGLGYFNQAVELAKNGGGSSATLANLYWQLAQVHLALGYPKQALENATLSRQADPKKGSPADANPGLQREFFARLALLSGEHHLSLAIAKYQMEGLLATKLESDEAKEQALNAFFVICKSLRAMGFYWHAQTLARKSKLSYSTLRNQHAIAYSIEQVLADYKPLYVKHDSLNLRTSFTNLLNKGLGEEPLRQELGFYEQYFSVLEKKNVSEQEVLSMLEQLFACTWLMDQEKIAWSAGLILKLELSEGTWLKPLASFESYVKKNAANLPQSRVYFLFCKSQKGVFDDENSRLSFVEAARAELQEQKSLPYETAVVKWELALLDLSLRSKLKSQSQSSTMLALQTCRAIDSLLQDCLVADAWLGHSNSGFSLERMKAANDLVLNFCAYQKAAQTTESFDLIMLKCMLRSKFLKDNRVTALDRINAPDLQMQNLAPGDVCKFVAEKMAKTWHPFSANELLAENFGQASMQNFSTLLSDQKNIQPLVYTYNAYFSIDQEAAVAEMEKLKSGESLLYILSDYAIWCHNGLLTSANVSIKDIEDYRYYQECFGKRLPKKGSNVLVYSPTLSLDQVSIMNTHKSEKESKKLGNIYRLVSWGS